MTALRTASWAAPGAFMLLVGTMSALGSIPSFQGLWIILSVLVAFGPSGWLAPGGWRRRAAEALLLPAAVVVVLVPSAVMRQMMVAPLLGLAAWVAWTAAVSRLDSRSDRVLLSASLGLSVRLLIGYWSMPLGWVAVGTALAASAIVPGVFAGLNPAFALIAVFVTIPTTLFLEPVWTWIIVVAGLVIAGILSRISWTEETVTRCAGWYPGLAAVFLAVVAIGAWGLPGLGDLLPGLNWIGGTIAVIIVVASIRLPPATAGACVALACLLIGPPMISTPEGGALKLDHNRIEADLRPGDGSPYVVDISVENLALVRAGAKIATLTADSTRVALRQQQRPDGTTGITRTKAKDGRGANSLAIWRPPPMAGREWKPTDRIVLDVADGAVPNIQLKSGLPAAVIVRLVASGPSNPIAPRNQGAERWLWFTAAAVAFLQLISGLWRRNDAWLPWALITAGLIVSRMAIEPLHLVLERHVVDLGLAALLLAWVPVAVRWVKRGQIFLTVAVFLVALALATPQLTPSLWGDEPYHLALAESVIEDHDFDLENNLGGSGATRELILSSGHLFHSPVLIGLLMPGFLVAGRTGALVLMALAGAGLIALVVRRYRDVASPPNRTVIILVLIACTTYPLVTFSTQIWPALLGALVIAALLLLVSRGKWAWLAAALLALVAVAAKTRLALVTLPVVFSGWWRGDTQAKMKGAVVVGLAGLGALAIGWWTMGHPFGYFRRLHHLLPTDPSLMLRVVGGLIFDVAGGLAWSAPLWLLAIVAVPLLWRRGGDGERALLLGGGLTVLALLHSIEWYGGGSPPGRYLIPMLPAILLTLGLLLSQSTGRRRLILFAAPAALMPWWALVTRPQFSINPGDGRWWLSNDLSRRFSADARALFPSFLTPGTATIVVPIVVIAILAILWWVCRRPRRAWWLARLGPAVWLMAALGLVAAVDLRADTVVESESAQIRRHGGDPAPPRGTPTRFSRANGWNLSEGDGLTFPLNLRGGESVEIEARIIPPGWRGILVASWNDGVSSEITVNRGPDRAQLTVPGPPGAGRHRLHLRWSGRDGAVLFVDRVVVIRE